jgi:hypothetical protein
MLGFLRLTIDFVPEPSATLAVVVGLAGLAMGRRRGA